MLEPEQVFEGHGESIYSVAFSPDNTLLATGSADKQIRLWSLYSYACVRELSGHALAVFSVAFSPDGRYLASGSQDKTACLWSLEDDANEDDEDEELIEPISIISEHEGAVSSVMFSSDSRFLATASWDKLVCLWDVEQGCACVATLAGHSACVQTVTFALYRDMIATASQDRTAKLWQLEVVEGEDGEGGEVVQGWEAACVHTLAGHTDYVLCAAFSNSPAGLLATASYDTTARLWSVDTGACLHVFSDHDNWLCCVAFSPCGSLLATSCMDETSLVYDVSTRRSICSLTGHTDGVRCAAWAPDGRTLATGSQDWKCRMFRVSPGEGTEGREAAPERPTTAAPGQRYRASRSSDAAASSSSSPWLRARKNGSQGLHEGAAGGRGLPPLEAELAGPSERHGGHGEARPRDPREQDRDRHSPRDRDREAKWGPGDAAGHSEELPSRGASHAHASASSSQQFADNPSTHATLPPELHAAYSLLAHDQERQLDRVEGHMKTAMEFWQRENHHAMQQATGYWQREYHELLHRLEATNQQVAALQQQVDALAETCLPPPQPAGHPSPGTPAPTVGEQSNSWADVLRVPASVSPYHVAIVGIAMFAIGSRVGRAAGP